MLTEKLMKPFRNKLIPVLLGLLILLVLIPLVVFLMLVQQNARQKEHAPGEVTADPSISRSPGGAISERLISRNVPTYASSGYYPASDADDPRYVTTCRSQ